MGNSGYNKLDKELIGTHNSTTAKSRKKILLIGTNVGKSHWFNTSEKHKSITAITYKIASFNIGNKLPDIDTIIYDTPENGSFFNETLKYISSANGLILTYSIHSFEPLNYLEKCMLTLDEKMNRTCSCLLLGMTETRKNNSENSFYYAELIRERANQLASKYGLMHMQIDISIHMETDTPYVCLLRKIMKQKQAVNSPVVTFEEEKLDITDDPLCLSEEKAMADPSTVSTLHRFQCVPDEKAMAHQSTFHRFQSVPAENAMAIYQSVVYGNNALLLSQNNTLNPEPIIRSMSLNAVKVNVPQCPSINADKKPVKVKDVKHFSLKSLNAFSETQEKPSKSKYGEIKSMDDDTICRLEFQRFFEESLGTKRSNKYIKTFQDKEYDDIRLVDPEIFDEDFFKSGEVKMDKLDQKLFQKEIKKYNNDKIKFQNILDSLNMSEKYRKTFENRGIASLWSFHFYISSVKNIKHIIKNKSDAKLIWNELCGDKEDSEGDNGDASDSEQLYEGNDSSVATGNTNKNMYSYL